MSLVREGEVYKRSTLEKVKSELVRSYSSNGKYGASVDILEVRKPRNTLEINIEIDAFDAFGIDEYKLFINNIKVSDTSNFVWDTTKYSDGIYFIKITYLKKLIKSFKYISSSSVSGNDDLQIKISALTKFLTSSIEFMPDNSQIKIDILLNFNFRERKLTLLIKYLSKLKRSFGFSKKLLTFI